MSLIQLNAITKYFQPGKPAIEDVTFTVEKGEIVTLLGPSGCGKTTTLRVIAGLETIDSGEITLADRPLSKPASGVFVPSEQRDLGMVFQSYALWPHMTIRQNLSLGLQVKKMDSALIAKRVDEALDLVGLDGMAERSPSALSGGQQQRVALARAIALRPKCVLFDEPLSNLDLLLREQMRVELRRLLKELEITAVYVTHDQPEALVISDKLIVMNKGRIQQVGPPEEVYRKPSNLFSASFLGGVNILQPAPGQKSGSQIALRGGQVLTTAHGAAEGSPEGHVIAIRPEALIPQAPGTAAENVLEGEVSEVAFLGGQTEVRFRAGEDQLMARVHGYSSASVGDVMRFSVHPASVMLLDASDAG